MERKGIEKIEKERNILRPLGFYVPHKWQEKVKRHVKTNIFPDLFSRKRRKRKRETLSTEEGK